MSVTNSFECRAHGVFEARVSGGEVPACPWGCSPGFVKLVFLTPPAIATDKVKTATRLVREMADAQGLTDIDISPSTPGNSVADKNYLRSRNTISAQAVRHVDVGKYIGAQTHQGNALTAAGFGHPYDSREWRVDKESGHRLHYAAPPLEPLPSNQFGVEMTRVRER